MRKKINWKKKHYGIPLWIITLIVGIVAFNILNPTDGTSIGKDDIGESICKAQSTPWIIPQFPLGVDDCRIYQKKSCESDCYPQGFIDNSGNFIDWNNCWISCGMGCIEANEEVCIEHDLPYMGSCGTYEYEKGSPNFDTWQQKLTEKRIVKNGYDTEIGYYYLKCTEITTTSICRCIPLTL